MAATPMVSVCIPVYNAGRYIGQAISSVLGQVFDDFELIISDNASQDRSADIARSFCDPRVRVYCSNKNVGMVQNWNRCLELARGRLVSIFHADDVMDSRNLAMKVGFMESNPEIGMVHSKVAIINEVGDVIGYGWQNQPRATGVEDSESSLRRMIRLNPVCAPSVLFRREVFDQLGGFDPSFTFAADWDMWLRIASRWSVGYIAEPLVFYRQHAGQATRTFDRDGEALRDEERVISHFLQVFRDGDKLRDEAIRGQALRAVLRAERLAAASAPLQAVALWGYAFRSYPRVLLDPRSLRLVARLCIPRPLWSAIGGVIKRKRRIATSL